MENKTHRTQDWELQKGHASKHPTVVSVICWWLVGLGGKKV